MNTPAFRQGSFRKLPLAAGLCVAGLACGLQASLDQSGPYLLGQGGESRASVGRLPAGQDDNQKAWLLGAGYQFTPMLSSEASLLDLAGKRTTDTLALSGNLHYALDDAWRIGARLGAYRWSDSLADQYGLNDSQGIQPWYGMDVNFDVTRRLEALAGWQRFVLPDRDDRIDLWSLGIRYYFRVPAHVHADPLPDMAIAPKPLAGLPVAADPVPSPVPVQVAAQITDSDQDGIDDADDQCAGTPVTHAVDLRGCTVFEQRPVFYRLVVQFANNSTGIDPKYNAQLQALADFVADYGVGSVEIVGHASAPGRVAYNQQLSERRAEAVAGFLTTVYGIDSAALQPVGRGESELLYPGNSAQAHAANRRVEIALNQQVKVAKSR